MPAALILFMQALPALVKVAQSEPVIGEYIGNVIKHYKQSGELTTQEEAELDAKIAQHDLEPWWQPE